MQYNNILSDFNDGITTITINRPTKLNALNKATIFELHAAIKMAESDFDTKVILLTGSGEKAFVAGADISEFAHFDEESGRLLSKEGHDLLFDFVEKL
jgi:enoyl-CoA hydratase